uniref:Variant surface glycoprotein 1125.2657 n=1 Tax=Trypanosoma brucei TaxID=5691 RepID=A0A1J0R894_9TRYP|nr:variant surface glycoprotein 1125.2657 [Trypanosoma brucei]
MPTVGLPDELTDRQKALQRMNMSTADEQWISLLKGDPATNTWDSVKTKYEDKPFKEGWSKKWTDWVTTAYETTKKEHDKSWITENQPPKHPWAKQAAHTTINDTLTELEKLQKQLTEAKTKAIETLPTQARKKISETLYGSTVTNNQPTGGKTTTDTGYATSRAASGGTSVWGDILCLCGLAGGTATADCIQSQLTIAWGTNPLTAIQAVKAACPTAKTAKLTPGLIRALIQRVDAKLERGGNRNALVYSPGAPNAGTCAGTTGELFIIYTNHYTAGNAKFGVHSITWVSKLEEAADLLDAVTQEVAKAQTIATEMRLLISLAERACKTKEPIDATITTQRLQEQTQTNTANIAEKSSECAATKKAAQCRQKKLACEWKGKNDEDGEHCKFNTAHT